MDDDPLPTQTGLQEVTQLTGIRNRIDEIDARLQALICERATCAQEVAQIKRAAGAVHDFYRPEREAKILRRVMERDCAPLSAEEMARLFREVMSACLALQYPKKIAFLGPTGTFTQVAVWKHFGHSVTTVPFGAIDEVFREVESGGAHFGVVPVENSTEGVITHTQDMFLRSPLLICGEVQLRIHHQLIGLSKNLKSIQRVYTHQQTLAQCREWLDQNLPYAERLAVSSNAEGAKRAQVEENSAAIASIEAAEIHNLSILAANIEDEPDNTTRFLVIGRHKNAPSQEDKTSILVSAQNRAGALSSLLAPFARYNVSMTRIESRPSHQGIWEYVFFIDIEGHVQDVAVATALKEVGNTASFLKVLGSYPRALL
ncbi:Chorismate mutase / Prephenate dehydratase [Gammaproteobacteria bacterium]